MNLVPSEILQKFQSFEMDNFIAKFSLNQLHFEVSLVRYNYRFHCAVLTRNLFNLNKTSYLLQGYAFEAYNITNKDLRVATFVVNPELT